MIFLTPEFLTKSIFHAGDPQEQTTTFYNGFCHILANKFANHWYEENPIKGQAFRSIIVDCENGFIDNILLHCAKLSKMHNIAKRLEVAFPAGFRMWIDPGEVEIEYLCNNGNDIIYSIHRKVTEPKRIQRPPSPQNFKNSFYEYYERAPSPPLPYSTSPPSSPYITYERAPSPPLSYSPPSLYNPNFVYKPTATLPSVQSKNVKSKPIIISQNCANEVQGYPVNTRYQQRVM